MPSENGDTSGERATWLALESNPDVLNKYMKELGVASSTYEFVDIYGTDPDLLAIVPQPVIAMILLYPPIPKKDVTELGSLVEPIPEGLFYMKQHIHNACGTIAMFHALANNMKALGLQEGDSNFKKFVDRAKGLTADERSKALEMDEALKTTHESVAREGQTEAPRLEDKWVHHFVCLTNCDNTLYALDGRLEGPVAHGPTSKDNFLNDAATVCKKYMSLKPDDLTFTMVALAKASDL